MIDIPSTSDVRRILALRLLDARRRAGLSRATLAQMAGMPLDRLALVERAGKHVTARELSRLADALGESWFVFFGGIAPNDTAQVSDAAVDNVSIEESTAALVTVAGVLEKR